MAYNTAEEYMRKIVDSSKDHQDIILRVLKLLENLQLPLESGKEYLVMVYVGQSKDEYNKVLDGVLPLLHHKAELCFNYHYLKVNGVGYDEPKPGDSEKDYYAVAVKGVLYEQK